MSGKLENSAFTADPEDITLPTSDRLGFGFCDGTVAVNSISVPTPGQVRLSSKAIPRMNVNFDRGFPRNRVDMMTFYGRPTPGLGAWPRMSTLSSDQTRTQKSRRLSPTQAAPELFFGLKLLRRQL